MRLVSLYIGLIFGLLLLPSEALAQDTIRKSKAKKISKMSKAAEELKSSLVENDELKIAMSYEKLAEEFKKKGDNAKAEEYLKKAQAIYARKKIASSNAVVTRGLAKTQESQNKYDDAIKSYEAAGAISDKKSEEKINYNDAERLKNASSPKAQAVLAKQKIEILEKDIKAEKEEVSDAYKQQAEANFKLKNSDEAIQNYNKAIGYAKDKPDEVIKIKNEIAKVYVAENSFEKAIAINEKLLTDAQSTNDFDTQITQLQELSSIYFKQNKTENALLMLKKAYAIANKTGKTSEVKTTVAKLLEYYKANNNDKESMALYDDFFKNFDQLIQKDTTLIDAKTFQVTEEKIRQLEKEKSLKDELITRKNKFNYVLIGSMALLLLFLGFIAKALFSIKRKNKEIALQSLRREMNPHFIFNSLNSVNQFISENKELEANKYLTNYSNLMRNMMENSNRDFVTLSSEIEQLKKYLDLEHLRFQDQFNFEIIIDENLDTETTLVPNMIVQPHLENAIWHGLRYIEKKGLLLLKFQVNRGKLAVIVDDNGIGLTKSQELKTFNQKAHISRGMNNTNERIALLNDLYKKEITFTISEKKLPETGTIVEINFPLMDKI
ncbi:histidine kinase [Flavobacterium sp.]|uniref:tetratricopeptide repeat-containing sensor histidine kinase n=1 Tax=Flavobacterium sp. TaxID=239 RepID=UPI00286E3A1E|nr:histidine kinase [Flavobacterium sp.]